MHSAKARKPTPLSLRTPCTYTYVVRSIWYHALGCVNNGHLLSSPSWWRACEGAFAYRQLWSLERPVTRQQAPDTYNSSIKNVWRPDAQREPSSNKGRQNPPPSRGNRKRKHEPSNRVTCDSEQKKFQIPPRVVHRPISSHTSPVTREPTSCMITHQPTDNLAIQLAVMAPEGWYTS